MRAIGKAGLRSPELLLVFALVWQPAWSDDLKWGMTDKTVPATPAPRPSYGVPDCSRANSDPRCRPQAPDHRAYPYYRRPVILNTTPQAPALDPDTLSDDWEGCRTAKLNAMQARDSGDMTQANRLDEWLWKNCRSYSEELRELEQDRM